MDFEFDGNRILRFEWSELDMDDDGDDFLDLIEIIDRLEIPFSVEVPGRINTIETDKERDIMVDGVMAARRVYYSLFAKLYDEEDEDV